MLMRETWFPAKESDVVVGRFVEVEAVDSAASRERGEEILRIKPVLQSKAIGSHDIAVQVVKPFNERELRARFPGAWEHYLEQKAKAAPIKASEPVIVHQTVPGTPLDKADFMPRDRLEWLALQGIQTIEQLSNLSDQQVQQLGRGVGEWRRKAKAFLQRT